MRSSLSLPTLAALIVCAAIPGSRAVAASSAPLSTLEYAGLLENMPTAYLNGPQTFNFTLLNSSNHSVWSSGAVTLTVVNGLLPPFWKFLAPLAGDASGAQNLNAVTSLLGYPVDFSPAPTTGQVLKFAGAASLARTAELLHWEGANQEHVLYGNGTPAMLGKTPTAMAYDGAKLWVATGNGTSAGYANELSAATLATLAVGNNPQALAFDGTNVWVANAGDGSLTCILINGGVASVSGTFSVGSDPVVTKF